MIVITESTFYDWVRTTRGTQIIAQHIPKVFRTSRKTSRLPNADFYYDACNGMLTTIKPNTRHTEYAHLHIEYLEGGTLRDLYNKSQNCHEAAMHARSCFQQLLPVFIQMNKFGFKYTDFNAGQYILVGNNKWYIIDMNVDFDEQVKHNPQFTD